MSWLAIVAVILQALLPVLLKWLDELFEQAAIDLHLAEPDVATLPPREGIRQLFARVRQRMTVWQWLWYGGALNRYERVMLRRADDVWECARAGKPLDLTAWERHEIEGY